MKKNILKILIVFLTSMSILCVFTGCSDANITTSFVMNDDFSGKREIKIDCSKVMDYISGGMAKVTETIENYQPGGFEYYIDNKTIVFSINYSNLDEYREKVAAALSAGDFDKEPAVVFENTTTPFKEGVYFYENFSTKDLIKWFINGLVNDGVVTSSNSSNIALEKPSVIINGTEYSNSSNDISIDEQERNTFDWIDITTGQEGSTYYRDIIFCIKNDTKTKLEEKMDLIEYFKGIYVIDEESEDSFSIISADDNASYNNAYDSTLYSFSIKSEDLESLLEKTNSILQSSNNSLELSKTLLEEEPGYAMVNLKEKLDGSYYLSSSRSGLYNISDTLDGYKNSTIIEKKASGISMGTDEIKPGKFFDETNPGVEYETNIKWLISPEKVLFDISNTIGGKVTVTLKEIFSDDLDDTYIDSAKTRLDNFMSFGGELSQDDKKIVIEFNDEENALEKMIGNFSENVEVEDGNFSVDTIQCNSRKTWKDASLITVNYDFSKVFGEQTSIAFEDSDGLFSDKHLVSMQSPAPAIGQMVISTTKISILGYVLFSLGTILLVVGAILFIKNKDCLAELKSLIKSKPIKINEVSKSTTKKEKKVEKTKTVNNNNNDDDMEGIQ